ncbi:uncharacterized protein LOC131661450 [Vicia villosa]|uniref:uncharacterized protein LOC131661450 n=1 Tax=Vicia villosa TaxID=3911 RepID=UPI00273B2F48|nr:uncharacterized protein LOC131661450 [Vicia villosa]
MGEDNQPTNVLKPEVDWNQVEDELALANSKALNAIFNGVDRNFFRLVNTCEVAKDIDNASSALGGKIPEEKLVRKMLRSLPKRFDMKVKAIDEDQDINQMKLNDLIGSLQTFELSINDRSKKKNKNIAFATDTEVRLKECDLDSEELCCTNVEKEEQLRTITKMEEDIRSLQCELNKVQEFIRVHNSGLISREETVREETMISNMSSLGLNEEDKPSRDSGHSETSSTMSHQMSQHPSEGAVIKSVDNKAWRAVENGWKHPEKVSIVKRRSYETMENPQEIPMQIPQKLCIKNDEVCKQVEKQKITVRELETEKNKHLATIDSLNSEMSMLNYKLDQMTKSFRMLNNGTDTLEEILAFGQEARDMFGAGFVAKAEFTSGTRRSKPEACMKNQMTAPMSQHRGNKRRSHTKKKFQRWRCHHFRRFGHIKPFCFRLVGYPNQTHQAKPKHDSLNRKQLRVAKNVALVAHTSLRMPAKEDWYLDSGCSNHMIGRKNLLVDIKFDGTSYGTLGDGEIGEVKGVGKSECPGSPNLNSILLVQRLTANLISISQLCDEGFDVRFTK